MDLLNAERSMSLNGALRFKLLPRRPDTDMKTTEVEVISTTVSFLVAVAPDHNFTLLRNTKAFDEHAQVIPTRKAQSMTWCSDIRTPELPRHIRRLGDLRLECRVDNEAGLISHGNFYQKTVCLSQR